MTFLLSWPEFEFLELSQGLWGAPTRKPTGLLLLNMPDMAQCLRRWQISSNNPTGGSIGLNSDGQWATSFLKEYPPALCAGLASGFVHTLAQHQVDDSFEPSAAFRSRAMEMKISDMGSCAGPDCAL